MVKPEEVKQTNHLKLQLDFDCKLSSNRDEVVDPTRPNYNPEFQSRIEADEKRYVDYELMFQAVPNDYIKDEPFRKPEANAQVPFV
mmetsp:Transcript_5503/g.8628  ORF Transcript_5503/g.8628 Transcript_5503/m.8628 type:complete len:86 (-) Transcript_5503:519-776(-)